MFVVVNAYDRYWDGLGWATQGKVFISVAAATRSLHEEGEELESVSIISKEEVYVPA